MEIYGKNYGFKLTVGAACEIAERCPGGELKNFRALISGDLREATAGQAALICALSRGWSEAQGFETGTPGPVLTPELLQTLDMLEFQAALEAALSAFLQGARGTVRLKESKKNGDGGAGEA